MRIRKEKWNQHLRTSQYHIFFQLKSENEIWKSKSGDWFRSTLRARRSWKSFNTDSLWADRRARVVEAGLLFRGKRGETVWPRRGFWLSFKMAREEDEEGEQIEVCISFSVAGFLQARMKKREQIRRRCLRQLSSATEPALKNKIFIYASKLQNPGHCIYSNCN